MRLNFASSHDIPSRRLWWLDKPLVGTTNHVTYRLVTRYKKVLLAAALLLWHSNCRMRTFNQNSPTVLSSVLQSALRRLEIRMFAWKIGI